jgi:hypothetical protein
MNIQLICIKKYIDLVLFIVMCMNIILICYLDDNLVLAGLGGSVNSYLRHSSDKLVWRGNNIIIYIIKY